MARSRSAIWALLAAAVLLLAGAPSTAPAAAPVDTLVLGTTDKITELSPANPCARRNWHVFRPPPAPAAAPVDTLVLGTTDKITELSPENSYDYWTWHVFGQISEALVQFKPGSTEIIGQLAQRWRGAPARG